MWMVSKGLEFIIHNELDLANTVPRKHNNNIAHRSEY